MVIEIVSFPSNSMVVLHSYANVYQMVHIIMIYNVFGHKDMIQI